MEFGLEQYEQRAVLASSIKGQMVISVNDRPAMRRVFKGLKIKIVPITSTVGGTQGRTTKKELIIQNW